MNHFGQIFFFMGVIFSKFLDVTEENIPKHQTREEIHRFEHLWLKPVSPRQPHPKSSPKFRCGSRHIDEGVDRGGRGYGDRGCGIGGRGCGIGGRGGGKRE